MVRKLGKEGGGREKERETQKNKKKKNVRYDCEKERMKKEVPDK